MAPQVVAHLEARTTKGHFMATTQSSAPHARPSTQEQDHPHACTDGLVFLTYTVFDEEVGDEVERVEVLPCRRCIEARERSLC
jgi:hypothetical protein